MEYIKFLAAFTGSVIVLIYGVQKADEDNDKDLLSTTLNLAALTFAIILAIPTI